MSSERRNTSSEAAADDIAGSIDLLTNILLCLPVKSLIRFKCVSKHWLAIISDTQFACNHATQNANHAAQKALISGLYLDLKHSLKKSHFGFNHSLKKSKSITLDGRSSPPPSLDFLNIFGCVSKLAITHSCNGLLLCMNQIEQLIVCNPTTQRYAVIPQTRTGAFGPRLAFGPCLAFDPSKSPHYKVVLGNYIINNDNLGHRFRYEVDIYNSNTGSWKHLEVSPQPPEPSHREGEGFVQFARCLSLNSHWAFSNGSIHLIRAEGLDHIRFDIDAEKLTEIPVPPNPQIFYSQGEVRYFGESGGRLILVQIPPSSGMGIRILEMDMDGEGGGGGEGCCHWKEMYRGPLIPVFPHIVYGNSSVLSVVKGSSEKHCGLVLAIGDRVVFYDMNKQTNTSKELLRSDDLHCMAYGYPYVLSHPFIESLFPV